jgi:hypothetical protein
MITSQENLEEFEARLPLYFKYLFNHNEIFCAPFSEHSSCKYGVIDLILESYTKGYKWDFIIIAMC